MVDPWIVTPSSGLVQNMLPQAKFGVAFALVSLASNRIIRITGYYVTVCTPKDASHVAGRCA